MICNFPVPHPDEILYSIWARYSDRVQYSYKTGGVHKLLGNGNARPILDLPCRLKYFVDYLAPGHKYTTDYFIDYHTLLPFYGAFFPFERLNSIKEQMRTGNSTIIHARSGITSGKRGIPAPSWLRYCPECVEDDRTQFGECYWHRSHQVPGVELCSTHRTLLEQSSLLTRGTENGFGLVSAEQSVQLIPSRPAASSPFFNVLMDIANEASYLLEHPFSLRDPHLFPPRYRALLAQHGFMTPKGLIRESDLLEAFTKNYPQEFFHAINCEIKIQGHPEGTLIAKLTRNSSRVYHPLYHILAIHFLGLTIESFHRQDHTLPSLFGKGPWPCLNPVCEHYQQRKILTYRTKEVLIKGKVTGVFSCTCGYVYVRSGPDLTPDDIFQKGMVLSYGPIWEAKLSELWFDTEVTLKSLAHQLGVDCETAKRKAALLNLPLPRGSSNIPSEKILSVSDINKDRYGPVWEAKLIELWFDTKISLRSLAYQLGVHRRTVERQAALLNLPFPRGSSNTLPEKTLSVSDRKKDRLWYRTQWTALLEEAPDEVLRVLQRRAKGVYSWLTRNDREWFNAHSPIPGKKLRANLLPETTEEDRQNEHDIRYDTLLAENIRIAVHKLINLPGCPVKITRNRIIRDVPDVRRLRAGMNRLPLATLALQEAVETREALVLRRIQWILDRYIEEGSCPRQQQFLDRAGLKVQILQIQTVRQAFEDAMNTLS